MIREVPLKDQRRRASRAHVLLRATLECQGRADTIGRVRDLSETGMKLKLETDSDQPLQPGETVVAHIRGIEQAPAEIVWRRGNELGVRFHGEVDPERALQPAPATRVSRLLPLSRPLRRPDKP